MMNLQDLHSVISHGIPMKIVIFNNDGYLMIKHTSSVTTTVLGEMKIIAILLLSAVVLGEGRRGAESSCSPVR